MIGESIFDWVISGISILIFASALIEGKTTRYPALFSMGVNFNVNPDSCWRP